MAGVPKLSSLQAQLRKSSPAPKPSSAAGVGAGSPAQGLKRPAEDPLGGIQAKKMAITKMAPSAPPGGGAPLRPLSAKAPIMKSAPSAAPGAAGAGGGLQAKLPPPSPNVSKPAPPAAPAAPKKSNEIEDIKALQAKLAALKAKANSLQAEVASKAASQVKSAPEAPKPAALTHSQTKAVAPMPVMTKAAASPSLAVAASQAKSLGASPPAKAAAPLPVKRPPSTPPVAVATNGQQQQQQQPAGAAGQEPVVVDIGTQEALKTFADGFRKHQGKAKLILLNRLVDAIHQDLPIEQTIYFHKLCRKKVVERAAADGVQLAAAPAAPVPAAALAASATKSASPAAPPRPAVAAAPRPAAPPRPSVAAQQAPAAAPAVGSANGAGASPPESPPAGDNSPLLALVSELTEDPVCEEGLLIDTRLNQVLKALWDGVAQRPKDWLAAWMAMVIPQERHAEVLQRFLNMAFVQSQGHNAEEAPMIIAELVKGHKIKMTVLEEVLVAFGHNLDGVLAMNDEAWHVYAYALLHLYPKPLKTGWGWSRVGWTWLGWWKFVEKTIASLEASKAFDVLSMLLRLVQDREGVGLSQVWNEADKMKQVLTKMAELGVCSEEEVASRLIVEGITVDAAA